ncbi:MAG: hypothetical protein RTV72_04115 [Candidatus Thorarchaeota archaeon]
MRVLHVSHVPLPDMRVEKTATTLKKNGHTNLFLGPKSNQYLGAFDEIRIAKHGRYLNLMFDPFLQKHWSKQIAKLKPDVVMAHDIIAAKFLLGSEYAVVYNDHEYWSKSIATRTGKKFTPYYRLQSAPFRSMAPILERKLLSRYPTIVTHQKVAEEHKRHGNWVGVAWNFPLLEMVNDLNLDNEREGSVYSGCDFRGKEFKTHRDMTGLKKFIEFDVICGVTHKEMMERLTSYRIGLTPWHPHPSLPYKDQNRNYEYLHAGLQVVLNEQLKIRFKDCPYVHAFKDYKSLQQVIEDIPNVDTHKIAAFAKKNYVWELNEEVIVESVKQATG